MRCWSYSDTVMQHAGQPPCSLPVSCETKPTLKHRVSHNSSAQLSLIQDGIYALGKAHMRSSPSLRSFSSVAFEMHKLTVDWTNPPAVTPLAKTQYCADCSLNCDYWGYMATSRLVAESRCCRGSGERICLLKASECQRPNWQICASDAPFETHDMAAPIGKLWEWNRSFKIPATLKQL